MIQSSEMIMILSWQWFNEVETFSFLNWSVYNILDSLDPSSDNSMTKNSVISNRWIIIHYSLINHEGIPTLNDDSSSSFINHQ